MAKDKKPTVKGTKQRAGLILSALMRSIAEEETELLKDPAGDDKMITKAEALARLIWQRGLGWVEQIKNDNNQAVEVVHQPDRVYVAMLLDRLEGRVAAVEPGKKEKRTVADKVGDQNKKRINAIAKDSVK